MQPDSIVPKRKRQETLNYISIVIASEISLICAVVLFFFAGSGMAVAEATGAALFVILAGTVLCLRSIIAAGAILVLSLLVGEATIMAYFPGVLWAFVILDLLVAFWLARFWKSSREQPTEQQE